MDLQDDKPQGKKLEEFIDSNNMHMFDEDNGRTNFRAADGNVI